MAPPLHGLVVVVCTISRNENGTTHRTANLRGVANRIGKSAKQTTKHARAARLQPPKISIRSHRLTAVEAFVSISCITSGGAISDL
jgi:hypothetical protein